MFIYSMSLKIVQGSETHDTHIYHQNKVVSIKIFITHYRLRGIKTMFHRVQLLCQEQRILFLQNKYTYTKKVYKGKWFFWWVHINLIFIRRSIHCSAHTKNYYPNDFIHVILHYVEHAMLCYVMFSEKKVIDCHKNNVIKCRTKNILPESRLSHTLSFESYGKYELHFSVFHCGPVFL